MRRFMTFAASLMLALAMLIAPDMQAQSRRGSGGSSTTQQQSSSRRSSGGSSSSSSTGSSGSSSGSSVRSSGASTSSTRSSGTVQQQQNSNRRSSGSGTSAGSSSSTRSGSSSSTRSSSSNGSSSSAVQQNNNRRSNNSGTAAGSSTRSTTSGSSSSNSARSSGSSTRSGNSGTAVSSSGSSNRARSSSEGQTRAVSGEAQQRSGSSARSSNVTRSGLSGTPVEKNEREVRGEAYRDPGYNYRYNDDMRVDDRHNMYRVPPRQRDPLAWDRPGHFWGDHPHYYGYRVHSLPASWRRISHWGMDYYYYNGVYYRPYGGSYVICRPPFGTPLEAAIDRAILRAIRFSYYYDTYRTFESAFDYYNVIARQNLIIAQQNARIIARNSNYAINSNRALSAYELANKLGLVQSYAYANAEYFYQDGVFYTISASGVYTTIVPPAGALVTSLPDDYEIIVMGGIEYYMVDNTVYRTTVFEGEPYLEVLGQMYGNLYNQYNVYR